MRKIISLLLAFLILLGSIPLGELKALADEVNPPAPKPPVIKEANVTKTYRNINNVEVMYIEVVGENLLNIGPNPVVARDESGRPIALKAIIESDFRLYYEILDPLGVSTISVNQFTYDLGVVTMPNISNISPLNRMVSSTETLIINGFGFKDFNDNTNGTIRFSNRSGADGFGVEIENTKISKKFLENTLGGPYRLQFIYRDENYNNTNTIFRIEDNYPSLFTVYSELGVSDDIRMIPNQGPVGSQLRISAENLTSDMSVFFLKSLDGTDSYRVDNRGRNLTYVENFEGNLDLVTVTVPAGLDQGRYHVVLTNNVNNESDLSGKVVSTKTFDNNIFTVIDSRDTISISDMTPRRGPETGIDSQIQGRYIGSISENIFKPNEKMEIKTSFSGNTFTIEYKNKDSESENPIIGRYSLLGDDGVDVISIKRDINVFIGNRATFRAGSIFAAGLDRLNIRVASIVLEEDEDPAKNVTIDVTTTIDYKDGDGNEQTLITSESAVWRNKFIFERINYKPVINRVIPDQIPVNESNQIGQDFNISIVGENFLKYRYTNSEGETKVKQPVINIGGQFVLDPNISAATNIGGIRRIPVSDMKIYNRQGVEIDGTPGNDLGNKIVVTIPRGQAVESGVIDIISQLKVTNPIKNEEDIEDDDPERHLGLSEEYDIRFVKIPADNSPRISSVSPNIITTQGQEGIIIRGQNFAENFKLYMDGEEIRNPVRNGTGTEIVFDAPARREGYVEIMVQNDNGSLAVFRDFLYVRTFTSPKIVDFNPKKGTANTLVDLKGENLILPNPLVSDLSGINFMRLIGTRVFIGGQDINTYAPNNSLQGYTSPDDNLLLRVVNNSLEASDYYHSIILEDEAGKYYKIHFDSFTGRWYITDGDRENYQLLIVDGKIHGKKGGNPEVEVTVEKDYIRLDSKNLRIKTPYAISGGRIIGNRVKVVNNQELYFAVPPQAREGYYDLAIVNPDTNRDERRGNRGFYYFFQPGGLPPVIEEIVPNQGSTQGGYEITIRGRNFVDRGEQKTSVIIGGIEVRPSDIVVAPDGSHMVVKVPPYPGNLAEETNLDRKSVNLVVINPDGGSDRRINGFSYVIPISNPRINRLILDVGTAAGGESVIIEGSDFRFFEPFRDLNNNGILDEGEPYTDLNNNGRWDDLRDRARYSYLLNPDNFDDIDTAEEAWEKNILPILPKVYFGVRQARITSFSASTIEVETPRGINGPVPVYIVNNDYGVSNLVIYNYQVSNPKINSITPNIGRRQGRDKIEILGSDFKETSIDRLVSKDATVRESMMLVRFGSADDTNMSNRSIPIDAPLNSGRIVDRRSNVEVGGLRVAYDNTGEKPKLNLSLEEAGKSYTLRDIKFDKNQIFIPLNLLKDGSGNSYGGHELVSVSLEVIEGALTTNRLFVDRGFAPEAKLTRPGLIEVSIPSYYRVGEVLLTVINPDRIEAIGRFNYRNPDSNPKISNILRDGREGTLLSDGRTIVRVNYLGGNRIEVLGEDFRSPVKIRIGEDIVIASEDIEYYPVGESRSTRLVFTMPKVDRKYINRDSRLIVENQDGGFAGSEPRYIRFIEPESSDLEIKRINPNFGPTHGGTQVTIEGSDFRSSMEGYPGEVLRVYFENGLELRELPQSSIISIDFDKIVIRTPSFVPGKATVKVENPDGNIAELKEGFNFISNPRIDSIVSPENDRLLIQSLSVEGGERIKLKGRDFMENMKVVFNPLLEEVIRIEDVSEDDLSKLITIEDKIYILRDGSLGRDVEILNLNELLVTSPKGTLDHKDVLVYNVDGGASNLYSIKFGIPEIGAPLNVRAELAFNRMIRINWSPVRDAKQYEILVSVNNGDFQYLGSTEGNSYSFMEIQEDTSYRFLVRAIGVYGTSKPLNESKSNVVIAPKKIEVPDEDGKLAEKTSISRTGNSLDIVLGISDFTSRGLNINLISGQYLGVEDITVRIPARLVVFSNANINIRATDYNLTFTPNSFANETINRNINNENAGVVFKIKKHSGNLNLRPGTFKVSEAYILEATTYVEGEQFPIDSISRAMDFRINHNRQLVEARRLNNIGMFRYDEASKSFVSANTINRLGLYTVIGSRR